MPISDFGSTWLNDNSAGSGPYKLESYTQGDKLVLARNGNGPGLYYARLGGGWARFDQRVRSLARASIWIPADAATVQESAA